MVAALVVVASALLAAPASAQTLRLYDDFNGTRIDPGRWRGYEHTVAGSSRPVLVDYEGYGGWVLNTERRREIVDGELRLALTTWCNKWWDSDDVQPGRGRLGLRVSDPTLADHAPRVLLMQATVTIVRAETRRPALIQSFSGSWATAGLYGVFFNDGSSTGPGDRWRLG